MIKLFLDKPLVIDPVTPSTLYVGLSGFGIYKSTDSGGSWYAVGRNVTELRGKYSLAIDPINPAKLYAVTSWEVFKSVDGGNNWQVISPDRTCGSFNAIAVDPVNPATVYLGSSCTLYKSADGGANWTRLAVPSDTISSLAVDPVNNATVYAATLSGVFKSADGGASWVSNGAGLPVFDLSSSVRLIIDRANPATLYVAVSGLGSGVYKSIDGGGAWNRVSAGLTNAEVISLAIDPNNPSTLYAGS